MATTLEARPTARARRRRAAATIRRGGGPRPAAAPRPRPPPPPPPAGPPPRQAPRPAAVPRPRPLAVVAGDQLDPPRRGTPAVREDRVRHGCRRAERGTPAGGEPDDRGAADGATQGQRHGAHRLGGGPKVPVPRQARARARA